MAGSSTWRSATSADHYIAHDFADFAQEFLRRNSDYRREWREVTAIASDRPEEVERQARSLAERWGLRSPCPPNQSPVQSPALWAQEHAVGVVTLELPFELREFAVPQGTEILVDNLVRDERHLVLTAAGRRYRLYIHHAPERALASFVIPSDAWLAARLKAADRLERLFRGAIPQRDPAGNPTRYQRYRLIQMLEIADALEAGVPTHTIAYSLVLPRSRPLAGPEWKASGERRHAQRLAAEARQMVKNGYRSLLRSG